MELTRVYCLPTAALYHSNRMQIRVEVITQQTQQIHCLLVAHAQVPYNRPEEYGDREK